MKLTVFFSGVLVAASLQLQLSAAAEKTEGFYNGTATQIELVARYDSGIQDEDDVTTESSGGSSGSPGGGTFPGMTSTDETAAETTEEATETAEVAVYHKAHASGGKFDYWFAWNNVLVIALDNAGTADEAAASAFEKTIEAAKAGGVGNRLLPQIPLQCG